MKTDRRKFFKQLGALGMVAAGWLTFKEPVLAKAIPPQDIFSPCKLFRKEIAKINPRLNKRIIKIESLKQLDTFRNMFRGLFVGKGGIAKYFSFEYDEKRFCSDFSYRNQIVVDAEMNMRRFC